MSATTNDSVEELKKLVLHNPVTLDLLQSDATGEQDKAVARDSLGSAAEIRHHAIQCPRSCPCPNISLCFEASLVLICWTQKVKASLLEVKWHHSLFFSLDSQGFFAPAVHLSDFWTSCKIEHPASVQMLKFEDQTR